MMTKNSEFTVPGIPDELFIRGKAPMTKEEIRVLTLSKLRLTPFCRVLDIGAGTGSVSVECALLSPAGKVYAVEKNPEAVLLIKQNCEKFGVSNVEVLEGKAPACLHGLPPVDGVVIGGSGGNLQAITAAAGSLLKPGGRLVVNAILLETLAGTLQAMKEEGFDRVELLAVSIARGRELGGKTALQPLNPVFIIWGTKQGERKEQEI